MIISHKYKFIFIHINKCGGTSITKALIPYLGKKDLILGCLPKYEKLSEEYLKKYQIYKHSTASEIRNFIEEDIWNKYFKFTFTRNPWSKILSTYFWFHKYKNWGKGGKADKIRRLPDFSSYAKSKYLDEKSCSLFIFDDQGSNLMNFIGKQENLDRDFAYVCGKLGLPLITLNKENNTQHSGYHKYYDEEAKMMVANKYADDIKNFNYEFSEL
ncbi:sulfotransferase family protein [Trichodesmium erythraeum 21-75]|nr:sulfotransferase family protein [Trichodesmium erythraeum 21-75]